MFVVWLVKDLYKSFIYELEDGNPLALMALALLLPLWLPFVLPVCFYRFLVKKHKQYQATKGTKPLEF